jgi:primosomal protein N'
MRCPQCFEDLEITLAGESYAYKCKNNHNSVPIDAHCPVCDNQNLLSLGASIEVIYKEIQKEFDIDIVKFDNEHDTKGQIKKYFNAYLENQKPTIFIGNDYLLNQIIGLDLTFDNFAIISLESLFAIPLYNMEHQIYEKIALISNHVNKNLIIQTRDSNNPFWKYLKDDEVEKIKNDVELKKLSLPPYTTHIQILVKTEKSMHILKTIKAYLESHVPYFEVTEKLKTTLHILMDKKEFEQSSITHYLKSLPAYIQVEVDSRNLL